MMVAVFSLIGLFIVAFLICAVLYPELVGIGGAKAKEIEASHREADPQKPDSPSASH